MSVILVVDDEERIRTFLARSLGAEGHSVLSAPSGGKALDLLSQRRVDLVLLDLAMPQGNGIWVLTAMQERFDPTPVIVLTAMTDQGLWVRALDAGAVDVVAKPFSVSELMARVNRHVALRPQAADDDRFIIAGRLRLDVDRRRASLDGRDIDLTEREFALLAHLMRQRGRVCRREELLHDVWDLDFDPGSNVVEACIRRLRAKLRPDPPIETIRHVGYCLSA